nr:S24 family peptidase [Pseudomonas protegens]
MTEVVEVADRKLRFSCATLRAAGVDKKSAAVARVKGRSMERLILDGAAIGFDMSDTSIIDGEIYAFNHGGMLRTKYLYRLPQGAVRISSENNDEYPDEVMSVEQWQEEVRMLGRVFWWSTVRVPFYNARGVLQGLLGLGWTSPSAKPELKLREAKQVAQKPVPPKRVPSLHEPRAAHPAQCPGGSIELETSASQAPSHNLRVAQQSATSMIDLIGNILDLDKIESGLMQLAPHPTALKPLLSNSLNLFAAQAREKNLQLRFEYQADPQRLYWIDSLRLQQIFHNLISNALKFTDQGHITVSVTEQPLHEGASSVTQACATAESAFPGPATVDLRTLSSGQRTHRAPLRRLGPGLEYLPPTDAAHGRPYLA